MTTANRPLSPDTDLFDCIQRALTPFTNFPIVRMDRSNGCASCQQADVLLDTDYEGYAIYVNMLSGKPIQILTTNDPREAAIEFVTTIANQLAIQAIAGIYNSGYNLGITSSADSVDSMGVN